MKNKTIKIFIQMMIILLVILGISFIDHSNSWAENVIDWSTIGAAGIVDEADVSKVNFYGGVAKIKDSKTGVLDLRYNIPALLLPNTYSLYELCNMTARIRDNGPSAQVIIHVKQYDILTGENTTLWKIDSNWVPPSDNFQAVGVCMDGFVACKYMIFSNNLYYLHVFIKKNALNAKAEFGGITFNAPSCMANVNYITHLPESQCICP